MLMVQNPWNFDVLVMENQLGDILSDLEAGLVGGLEPWPSAEIGEDHTSFQPSHGTAPQLAGKNVANPLATILSAGMMLDWLADKHNDKACLEAAVAVEAAVAQLLNDGAIRTPDPGGTASTTEVANAVADLLTAHTVSLGGYGPPQSKPINRANGRTEYIVGHAHPAFT